jgi:hypothetical protein
MKMSTVYRIEIDIRIDNRTRTKVIQAAREDYCKSPFAWTMVDGELVEISAEEFVVDTKTAFLELAESAFRSVLPDIEPDRFSCGLAEPELGWRDAASWRNSVIADCRGLVDGAIAASSSGPNRPRWRYLLCTRLRPPQRFRDTNWSPCSRASCRMGSGPLLGLGLWT